MKTLCVTGGNGLLGTKILQAASGSYRLVSIDLDEQPVSPMDRLEYVQADVTDRTRIREVLSKNRPDCVVHTAAITHVDRCETEQEKAWSVNVEGTENVARACRALARTEGLIVGITSGATALAARSLAGREDLREACLVCVLADTGERYLSMGIYEDPADV